MDPSKKSIEEQRLEFDQLMFEKELALKNAEFLFKEKHERNHFWTSPVYIALIAAIVGLFSNATVSYFNNPPLFRVLRSPHWRASARAI